MNCGLQCPPELTTSYTDPDLRKNRKKVSRKMEDIRNGMKGRTYCVTGATGYIGSWLVNSLLHCDCTVHATFRNPENMSPLMDLWQGRDRLSLFRADLLEDGSFDEAVRGCDGVFHVSASMEFGAPDSQNIESYVKKQITDPAVKGTLNVLKACLKSNTVRRVVFTSSVSTLTAKDRSGRWVPVVDESCQTPVDHILKTKASGWVYALSKRLTEEAAFQYAKENGIDLISVITATVGGPFLTPTVPSSIQVLLSPLTGDPSLLPILASVNSRMGSIALVHIEDTCNAHIFLMEHGLAEGRYLCCTRSCGMSELLELLRKEYPSSIHFRVDSMKQESVPSVISSKKIRDMGFEFKHSVEGIIHETVKNSLDYGFLSLPPKPLVEHARERQDS